MGLKRQTLWSMLPLLVVTVVNIVSVPLFYRYLGPEMYALWLYVLTFTGVFGFMDLGLGVAVGRYIGVALGKGDHQSAREYWGTGNAIAVPLLALMATIFAIVGAWFGPQWFNVLAEDVSKLRWSFAAGGLGLFFSYYGQFWLILSQAHLDFRFLGLLRTITSLLQVLPAIYLAWKTRNPLVLIAWGAAIGALQLAVFVWHARTAYRIGFDLRHAQLARAREMAGYTARTFVSMIVGSVSGSLDRLVLGKLAPAGTFAHYSICANVGGRIQGLSQAVMGPVFSHTNRAVGSGEGKSTAAVYDEAFHFVFPWYALVCAWMSVWHPLLLRVWLGESLGSGVAPMFMPVLVGYCVFAISGISSAQFSSLNRIGTTLLYSAAASAVTVVAIYWGWIRWGATGVAWGFLVSRCVFISQDIHLSCLVKAGGWLAWETWKHLLSQLVVAAAFVFAARYAGSHWVASTVLATVHGSIAVLMPLASLRRQRAAPQASPVVPHGTLDEPITQSATRH